MTPLDCLREVREATAAEIAARTGEHIDDVYEVLVRNLDAGRVRLNQHTKPGKERPVFTWSLLGM
jgi:predicted transcriptional regulator